MKIVDKIAKAQEERKPFYSLEYFPPKTEVGVANLYDRMGRMAQTQPAFISCTWGAGGSTSDRTIELCATAQSTYGLETLMHLTCTNMGKDKVDLALKQAKNAGIQNILALRGDPPRGQEYWAPCDNGFCHAIDLVRYIRQQYGDYFCIGVAGYPEGHVDSPDKAKDVLYLKEKIDAGADFVVTQLFYDIDTYVKWQKQCRDAGISVPIITGVMPIQSHQAFRRIINLCNTNVPPQILEDLNEIKADDQAVKDYGVKLAVKMVSELYHEHQIACFHFSTLNLEKSVRLVLQELNFLPKGITTGTEQIDPVNLNASSLLAEAHRAETWDEFPNGRYGDSRSPAFGDNTYGAGVVLPTSKASVKWGYPKQAKDITELFLAHINGSLQTLPWCDEPLQTETDAIRQSLAILNKSGLWTVGSQPSVNGAPSADPVFGWGPAGGYVYQKEFIEFFVCSEQLSKLLERLAKDPYITYYGANRSGQSKTNVHDRESQNAVTWGVFPGKEIVQTTIIEEVGFNAWRVEAFELWTEWEQQYPPDSESNKLLKHLGDDVWLFNVVHNDFQNPGQLFEVILG
ncbi:methylenetetrahydrofolate reductase 1 [Umbelopsis sp. WA50703]